MLQPFLAETSIIINQVHHWPYCTAVIFQRPEQRQACGAGVQIQLAHGFHLFCLSVIALVLVFVIFWLCGGDRFTCVNIPNRYRVKKISGENIPLRAG
jgi:hypothetical protein